jgi:hypothetical protein
MRRVFLLGLLALALPTAALAGTIDYQGFGTKSGGTVSYSANLTAGGSVSLTMELVGINTTTGNLGMVSIAPTLGTSCGTGCFNITGGSLNITNTSSVSLFSGTFTSGTVTSSGGFVNIQGFLANGSTVSTVLKFNNDIIASSDTIIAPEPGTLGLLGTGLVGLAGVIRRKVRQ